MVPLIVVLSGKSVGWGAVCCRLGKRVAGLALGLTYDVADLIGAESAERHVMTEGVKAQFEVASMMSDRVFASESRPSASVLAGAIHATWVG